jgi:hypothetical protein
VRGRKINFSKLAEADDLYIAPFREDGRRHGTPTWIWSVAVDDGPYLRQMIGARTRAATVKVMRANNSLITNAKPWIVLMLERMTGR